MTKKIILVLDLDETIFDSAAEGIVWYGGKACWIDLCNRLENIANDLGVEFHLHVVTAKQTFDDLCAEVADKFRRYWGKDIPGSYVKINGELCCLVRDHDQLKYCEIKEAHFYTKHFCTPDSVAHIEIVSTVEQKIEALARLARNYDVLPQNIIMVDDCLPVCVAAQRSGFQAICAVDVEHTYLVLHNAISDCFTKIVTALQSRRTFSSFVSNPM